MRRGASLLLARLLSAHKPQPWPVLSSTRRLAPTSCSTQPCASAGAIHGSCLSIHTSTAVEYAKKDRGGGSRGGRDRGGKAGAPAAKDDEEPAEFDVAPFERSMSQAVQHFQQELGKIHTGRASPGLLEPIEVVKAQGDRVPLKSCGTVTARTASLLVVNVYNDQDLELVAKSIRNSPLKLQARVEGKEVQVPVPRPTMEQIQGMQRLVAQEAEKTRVTIRGARSKAMDRVKAVIKATDYQKRASKEVQDVTDRYMSDLEKLRTAKDKELHDLR